MSILNQINNEIDAILPEIINIRHQLHQAPEIALKEFKTSSLVRNVLGKTDLTLHDPYLETDVIAMLNPDCTGKNVTLRADMDALSLQEKNDCPHKSQIDGMMHACGHDGHTAMLLGAALVLNKFKSEINGSVRFAFQPGEEVIAAGKQLVEAGILNAPKPDMLLAIHAWSHDTPAGTIISKAGPIMAAANFFKVTIQGKGAHGSRPVDAIDPIQVGVKIIEAFNHFASREINAQDAFVLSTCQFNSGTGSNIIPDTAELQGTTRYFNLDLEDFVPQRMEEIVAQICKMFGATYEFSYDKPYIPTINNAEVVDRVKRVVKTSIGTDYWQKLQVASMGGEDFSYFIKDNPGAMLFIGMGKDAAPLHNPKFDFNDNALKAGIQTLALSTLDFLNGEV